MNPTLQRRFDMSRQSGWGVKWHLVQIGAGLMLFGGVPAGLLLYFSSTIYMWLWAVSFTGLLVALWGLMGEGAKW